MFTSVRVLGCVLPGIFFAVTASSSVGSTLDLTHGGSGTINGGIFSTLENRDVATGTGVFQPFLRLQHKGVEQGYNTDRSPKKNVQFNEKVGVWTHSIRLSDLSLVKGYYQFALDIGEPAKKKNLISLDMLQLFSTKDSNIFGATYNAANQAAPFGASATKLWDLDSPQADNSVKLDYNLVGKGNGRADMLFLLPKSVFANVLPSDFIVLYSKFGDMNASNGSFEEWAALKGPLTAVPLPASLTMMLTAFTGLGWLARRRRTVAKAY